jgi:hypothetical protein
VQGPEFKLDTAKRRKKADKSAKAIQHINKKVEKSYHHLNKCKESLQENAASLHNKSSEEIRNRKSYLNIKVL